jgi:hypothetical protein
MDASGEIVVTGNWREPASRLRVERLSADGRSLWEFVDDSGGVVGGGVSIDANGNTIVVGETETDWLFLALSPQGELLWRFTHDGGGGAENEDQAFAVAVHPAGGFVVAGLVHPRPPRSPSRGLVDWRIARYQLFPE